jgi:hypothetical protein
MTVAQVEQNLGNLFRREVLRRTALSGLRYRELASGILRQHLQFDGFIEHRIEVHPDFGQNALRVSRRPLVEVCLQRELVQIAEESVAEALEQVVLDEALRLWSRRDLPLLLLLRQEAVFVEPAKCDVHRRRSDIFRLSRDDLAQLGLGPPDLRARAARRRETSGCRVRQRTLSPAYQERRARDGGRIQAGNGRPRCRSRAAIAAACTS